MTEKEIFINQMKAGTKYLALDTIAFCNSLPGNRTCHRIGDQLLRSGTSVGANYRAACRSRSKAEFYRKSQLQLKKVMKVLFGLNCQLNQKNKTFQMHMTCYVNSTK